MVIVIKNNKNHFVNLGKQNGKMLVFAAEEERELSEDMAAAFESQICQYVEGNLLSIVTKKKAARVADSIEETTPSVKKKKVAKKKAVKVAKE